MGRGIQVMLGLGLAGLWLAWGAGLLGEPRSGLMGGRDGSRLAKSIPVAPKAEAAHDVGRQAPPAMVPQPGGERKTPGETLPLTGREGGGPPPRLPAQIAHLVQGQNLAKVIEKYAQHYGVDQDLVWAVIRQESDQQLVRHYAMSGQGDKAEAALRQSVSLAGQRETGYDAGSLPGPSRAAPGSGDNSPGVY